MVIITDLEDIAKHDHELTSNSGSVKDALDRTKSDEELAAAITEAYERMHSELKIKHLSVD